MAYDDATTGDISPVERDVESSSVFDTVPLPRSRPVEATSGVSAFKPTPPTGDIPSPSAPFGGATTVIGESAWDTFKPAAKPPAAQPAEQPQGNPNDPYGLIAFQTWMRDTSLEHSNQAIGQLERRTRQLEDQNAAVAHSIDNMPQPWNADREMQERIRGPFENFGSFATIFALTASAFTKQPMVNAMQGAAAAMTAMRNSDEEGYKLAYQAWKDNTDLAYKRYQMEQQVFNNTDKLFSTDMEKWKVQKEADLAQFGHETALAAMRAGYYPQVFEWQKAQAEAAKGIVEAREQTERFNESHSFTNAESEAAEKEHPDWQDHQKKYYRMLLGQEARAGYQQNPAMMAVTNAMREYFKAHGSPMPYDEVISLLQRARSFGGLTTSKSDAELLQQAAKEIRENGEVSPETQAALDARKKLADAKKPTATDKPASKTQADAALLDKAAKELLENGEISPETQAALDARKKLADASRPTTANKPLTKGQQDVQIAQMLASGDEEQIKQANILLEKRKEVADKIQPGEDYTPLEIKHLGAQYLLGDTSVVQNLRGGARAQENQRKIKAEAIRQQEEQGLSDQEVATRRAEYQGLKAAERTIYTRAANIAVSASEAEGGLAIARAANEALPRDKFVPWNRLKNMTRAQVSDERVWALRTALNSLRNEYANVISRSGVAHQADKEKADELLNPALSQKTLEVGVFQVMEKEIQRAKAAPIEARRQFKLGLEGTGAKDDKPKGDKPLYGRKDGIWYKLGPNDKKEDYDETRTSLEKRSAIDPMDAEQAPDGNFYLPDPSRPGKYLMVTYG